jgi:hypothetical protein
MVRAILDNRKSQTRRFVKPQPPAKWDSCEPVKSSSAGVIGYNFFNSKDPMDFGYIKNIPYEVGDRLYVRETIFQGLNNTQSPSGEYYSHWTNDIEYYADGNHKKAHFKNGDQYSAWMAIRPSIHMPKEAARLWLEVTGVRVERLQDITEEDARAEGVESFIYDGCGVYKDYGGMPYCMSAKESYRTLWESLYGRESWEANPWLFVYEFKRANNGEVH